MCVTLGLNMKTGSTQKRSVFTIVAAIIACGLVLSFGLHTIQLDHTHPGSHHLSGAHAEDGTFTFSEYLHGTEKKLFILTIIGFLLAGAFVGLQNIPHPFLALCIFCKALRYRSISYAFYRSFDLYLLLFKKGLLNTKAY